MRTLNLIRDKNSKLLLVLGFLWSIALLGGFTLIAWYSNNAGEKSSPPRSLSRIMPSSFNNTQYQLFMFIHPKCPCSRSSIRELERLISRCPKSITSTFFCYLPSDKTIQWSKTDIMGSAQSIPHSKTIYDIDGTWAKNFDAKTSGHVLLYDTNRTLVFSGGITAGRGHEGESIGRTWITKVVRNKSKESYECPVFGCPIFK